MQSNKYKIKSEVWLYPGDVAYHFVNTDRKTSDSIRKKFGISKRGFGSFPVVATLGKTTWKTSIFPDRRSGTYMMFLKKEIRKKEGIMAKDKVSFTINIMV